MKIVVCAFGLVLLIVAVVGVLHEPAGAESPVTYSSEFKKQARTTLDAIQRMERFAGALPEYEADKALDVLSGVSAEYGLPLDGSSASANQQLSEQRAIRLLQNYKGAVERYQITKADKERRALAAIREEVARTKF